MVSKIFEVRKLLLTLLSIKQYFKNLFQSNIDITIGLMSLTVVL